MEPFYVRQTANPEDLAERREWFRKCTEESKSEGAQHARFSMSPDGSLILTEAWKERRVPDEGAPRFSYAAVD